MRAIKEIEEEIFNKKISISNLKKLEKRLHKEYIFISEIYKSYKIKCLSNSYYISAGAHDLVDIRESLKNALDLYLQAKEYLLKNQEDLDDLKKELIAAQAMLELEHQIRLSRSYDSCHRQASLLNAEYFVEGDLCEENYASAADYGIRTSRFLMNYHY